MSLTQLSIKKPVVVIAGFLVLILFGLFGYTQMRYELLPNFNGAYVNIIAVYPGASPSEVETGLTKPLEQAVSMTDGIKRIVANSSENISNVFIEFESGIDPEEAYQNAQRRVNGILSDLPEGAKTPVVTKINVSEFPVLRIAATGKQSGPEFGEFLKEYVRPRLAQVEGVGTIELIGLEEREIQVELDARKLELRGVSVLQVMAALHRANLDVPAGNLDNTDVSTAVRVTGKADNLETLKEIIVSAAASGATVKLGEVASVRDTKKPSETVNRLEGQGAVGIFIQKQNSANALDVSTKARAELARLEAEYADRGLRFDIAQDSSEYTVASNKAVQMDLLLAILLVAGVMLVFLHSLRSAFIVLVAIPVSLVATFTFMWTFGFSLNMMTLLAMSLVVGILVDDAIVVLENIHRHLEKGKNPFQAALDGRNEIGFTALAITLVDVVVFLPLVFTDGLAGDLIREFAGVIVVSTLLSLLVCFTLTPMMSARISRLEHPGAFGRRFERVFAGMENAYGKLLDSALNRRKWVKALVFALFIATMMLPANGFIGGEFIPPMDKGEIALTVQLPASTTLAETDRVARELEEHLAETMPEIRKIFSYIGSPGEVWGPPQTSNFELNITFSPKDERTRSVVELAQEAKFKALAIPGARVKSAPIGLLGMADEAPVQLVLNGENRDSVRIAAERVAQVLAGIDGACDVRLSAQKRKPEIRIEPLPDKLAENGLSTEDLGMTARVALAGDADLRLRQGNRETPIRIRIRPDDAQNPDALRRLTLTNRFGKPVSLSQVARLSEGFAPASLERKDRENSVTVFAQPIGRPSGDIGAEFKTKIEGVSLSGARIRYEGDLANQEESFGSMGAAMLGGILLMYLVMVALYESWSRPFIVLFSIPVAMIGALLALALTGNSMNIFSIFGMIMMIGLVAKNAILLVDRANDNRRLGLGVRAALIESGKSRLRPIVMTTLAMIIGMLPIAIGHGLGGELKRGLGWALIGGLSSSMFLTLVLVPIIFYDFEKIKMRVFKIFKLRSRHKPGMQAMQLSGKMTALLIGLTFPALPQIGSAQQVQTISLAQAIDMVEHQNPELDIARLEIDKARAKSREAKSQWLPAVAAEGQYRHNLYAPVFFFPDFTIDPATGEFGTGDTYTAIRAADKNVYQANLTVSAPIFNPGLSALNAVARAEIQRSEADLQTAVAGKVFEVKKLYLQIQIAEEQSRLAAAAYRRSNETLADTRILLKNGLALDLDTLRAFVAVQNLAPGVFKAEKTVFLLKQMLAAILNLPAGDFELSDGLDVGNQNDWIEKTPVTIETAFSQRPEFRQIAAQNTLLDAATRAERAKYLPSVSAFGQGGYSAQAPDLELWNNKWVGSALVGIQLNVPIFTASVKPRLQQVDLSRRQTVLQNDHLKRMVGVEIESATINLGDARQRLQNQAANISAAARSLDLIKSRWKKGLAKLPEVSDAELALHQAQTNRLQALFDYLTAHAEVQKAIGVQ